MITRLSHVTILVKDEEEALRWYTEKLGLVKKADMPLGPGARWLTVGPKNQDIEIVLQKPNPAMQGAPLAKELTARIGKTWGMVFDTDDCRNDYKAMLSRGVRFQGPPEQVPWGIQAVFSDLYGNQFVLVERPKR